MERIRVLLVDDHAVVRAGLAALLEAEPDLEVVGTASTGEEAVTLAEIGDPQVVVMDLSMPGMGGLEATRAIRDLGKGISVLILTVHAEEEYLLPVLEAGGSGYVTKDRADRELIEAVRMVARGEVFLYPTGARLLVKGIRNGGGKPEESLSTLSCREREVLLRTAQGFSATEIADELKISSKTVDTYRQRAMEKLALSHRSELVRFALRTGLLTPEAV
jgi:DNA-binding NarL/FixJ family response regulator